MSKLLNNYVKLKSKNPNKLYLFKSGIFYIFIDEDAKIISSNFGLKLTNLNNDIVKCGFPTSSLEKYLNLFKTFSYDIEIIDLQKLETPTSNNLFHSNMIKNFIINISNINSEELSIKEAYSTIDNIVNQCKEFINDQNLI